MNFIVHGPETKEEQEILNTKMAAIHADMIKVRLACSSLNEISKRKLIKEIYYEVTEENRQITDTAFQTAI